MMTSDSKNVQQLRDVVASAIDITTIGCLSLQAGANLQRLLCETSGEPLTTVIAHLYVSQSFQQQSSGRSWVLERICEVRSLLALEHKA